MHSIISLPVSSIPRLLQTYNNILKEQLNRDFIEPVLEPRKSDTAHYISHHPVKKNSDTTPIRIVYNCSCHQSSKHLLNDCLLTGPSFLADLCAIILHFRQHQCGLSTNIEKAFLHITLAEEDRNFTRFLWLSPIRPYQWIHYLQIQTNIVRRSKLTFYIVCSIALLFATVWHSIVLQHPN